MFWYTSICQHTQIAKHELKIEDTNSVPKCSNCFRACYYATPVLWAYTCCKAWSGDWKTQNSVKICCYYHHYPATPLLWQYTQDCKQNLKVKVTNSVQRRCSLQHGLLHHYCEHTLTAKHESKIEDTNSNKESCSS